MYDNMNGEAGKPDWTKEEQFVKLKEFSDGCLAQMNEEEEGGDEYYDEEEGKE